MNGHIHLKKWHPATLALCLVCLSVCCVCAFGAWPFIQLPPLYVTANADAGLQGDITVQFNGTTGTIYLPGGVESSALSLSWDSSVSVSRDLTPCVSGATGIPAPGTSQTYTITVDSQRTTVTLKTLQGSSEVPGMFLVIDESEVTIAAMNNDANHNTTCSGTVAMGQDFYDVTMKRRGNSTWRYGLKKPYNITLYKDSTHSKKQKVTWIDGVKSSKWSLLANYADGSLLRNKVGYDLACQLGIGLESRFVDVWLNGAYLGNYLLTPKSDYQAPDGGYMLELDNNASADDPQFPLDGLESIDGFVNQITVKDVGDDASVTTEEIQAWMQTALDAICDDDSDEYLRYIDLDSWAKLYLLHEFYKSYDVLSGSLYMYRNGLTADDKLFAGPVWDLDNALGRSQICPNNGIPSAMQTCPDGWYIDAMEEESTTASGTVRHTSLLQYLGKHPDFMQRVYELYQDYASDFDGVSAALTEQSEILAASAQMNFSRWDINQTNYNVTNILYTHTEGAAPYTVTYVRTTKWEDYVNNMNAYVTQRAAFFSDQLAVSAPSGTISGETCCYSGETVTLTAETGENSDNILYCWQCSVDGNIWVDIPGENGNTFSFSAESTTDGQKIRCLVQKCGAMIQTERVAQVQTVSAKTALAPVELTMSKNRQAVPWTAPANAVKALAAQYCEGQLMDSQMVDCSEIKSGYCYFIPRTDAAYRVFFIDTSGLPIGN